MSTDRPAGSGSPPVGPNRGRRRWRRTVILLMALVVPVAAAAAAVGSDEDDDRAEPDQVPEQADGAALGPLPWAPLTLVPLVDVRDRGAAGDGDADDTEALQRAFASLPDGGGIVWLPPGGVFRTEDVVTIVDDHVKVWAPDGQAEIVATPGDRPRRRALVIDGATSVGVFGVRFRSDSDRRRTAREDSGVVVDGSVGTELVGLEVTGAASAAVFVFGGSRRTWIAGNDLHDNWADAIHFTDGSRQAWAWNNVIANRGSTPGDDGIACVTYGSGGRCGAMEWWDNVHLGGGWGRGLSVVGGDDIDIHDNVVLDTAAAGILIASEPSYETPGSESIRIEGNLICRAGHTVPHSGILISGLHGTIADVVVADNTVVESWTGEPIRIEGEAVDVVERGTSTDGSERCRQPNASPPGGTARSTSTLSTRDTSFVPEPTRRGLHRLHVRPGDEGGFEQVLEYVVAGPPAAVDDWLDQPSGVTGRFRSPAAAEDYVVVYRGTPVEVPGSLRAVSFEELRAVSADLPALWSMIDDR